MAQPDQEGSTLTLERQLEQLRDTLPAGERQILAQLLQQMAEQRNSDPEVIPGPAGSSDMPSGEARTDSSETLPSIVVDTTVPPADEMQTAASEMPPAAMPVSDSGMFPDGPNEMPQLLASVADEPVEAHSGEQVAVTEAAVSNEMPASMPGFGGDYEMPVATGEAS